MSEVAPELRYPPYVLSEADRQRWDLCEKIAVRLSELYEEHANPHFVLHYTRYLYRTELETGSAADEPPPDLAEAEEVTRTPADYAGERRAWEMWDELERTKPGDDEADPNVHWAHVAKVADLFDELFGNPDEMNFGEHEGRVGPDREIKLREAFEHVAHLPYNSELHPRDRMGKWSMKMNALRSYAGEHRAKLRKSLASSAAAVSLRVGVAKADEPGGALHADVKHAHAKGDERLRARAHATEERARSGLSGRRQQAEHAKEVGRYHAVTTLATIYSSEAERKLGPFHESTKDAQAAADELDHAKMVKEASHHAAHWAVENQSEIKHVAKVASQLAQHVARSRGLAAADDEPDPPEPLLEFADFELDVVLDEMYRELEHPRGAGGEWITAGSTWRYLHHDGKEYPLRVFQVKRPGVPTHDRMADEVHVDWLEDRPWDTGARPTAVFHRGRFERLAETGRLKPL